MTRDFIWYRPSSSSPPPSTRSGAPRGSGPRRAREPGAIHLRRRAADPHRRGSHPPSRSSQRSFNPGSSTGLFFLTFLPHMFVIGFPDLIFSLPNSRFFFQMIGSCGFIFLSLILSIFGAFTKFNRTFDVILSFCHFVISSCHFGDFRFLHTKWIS